MRFIAYGCSYTQGAELADDWLTGKHHLTIDKEKKSLGVDAFYQKYTKDYNRDKYERIMAQKSYAAKVAAAINADAYINRATAGKSNKAIFLDVVEDMQSGFIQDDDLIFVGFTSSDRYTWFQNGKTHYGLPMGGSWPNPKLRNQILKTWSDDDYLYDTVVGFYALKGLLKNHKFFYQTVHYPYTDLHTKSEITQSIWNELINIERTCIVPGYSFWMEIEHGDYENPTHGFHHPRHEIANAFGQKVGIALKKKLGLEE